MSIEKQKYRNRRLDAARGYLILRMPECALRELRKIQSPEFCEFDTWLLTAEAHRDLDQFDEAIPFFEKASLLQPGNLQAHLGLAWCYKRIDRLMRAIESLENAKQHHPEEPIIIYNLACYFSLLGDKPKAIECRGRS